jgi:hypothetical protein
MLPNRLYRSHRVEVLARSDRSANSVRWVTRSATSSLAVAAITVRKHVVAGTGRDLDRPFDHVRHHTSAIRPGSAGDRMYNAIGGVFTSGECGLRL